MRFDQPPKPLGFGKRWVVDAVDSLAWCPGDKELVVAGGGTIRWVSAVHGRVLAEVELTGVPDNVACRADGTVLTIVEGVATLVGRDKKILRSPAGVTDARFADDGSVRFLDANGYEKWDGTTVEHLSAATTPAFVVEHGGLVTVHDKAMWLTIDGKTKKLGRWRDENDDWVSGATGGLGMATLTDDGVVVGTGDMGAMAWSGGKPNVISGSLGAEMVYASKKWFVFTMGDQIWTQRRPDLAYAHIDSRCGETIDRPGATRDPAGAISTSGTQLAVACGDVLGIRVIDLASLTFVAGRNPLPIASAMWSSDRLATRDMQGTLQIWRDAKLERTIDSGYPSGDVVWWSGDDIASATGMGADERARWSTKTGKRGKPPKIVPLLSAAGTDFTLHVSWVPDGLYVQRGDKLDQIAYSGHKDPRDLAVSPDGKRAIMLRAYHGKMVSSPEGLEPDVVVIDVVAKTSRILPILTDAVAISDDHIAVGIAQQVSFLVDDKLVSAFTTASTIESLAYSPDNRVLAVGGQDGSIAIYAGTELVTMLKGHTLGVRHLQWHGNQLLSIADDQTLIWTF